MNSAGEDEKSRSETDGLPWLTYEEALQVAEKEDGDIMLFMEADWCSVCKRMKREVFSQAEVQKAIDAGFSPVLINIDSKEELRFKGEATTKMDFSKRIEVQATPTFIFLNHEEEVIGSIRGFLNSSDFIGLLDYVRSDSYHKKTFEDFLKTYK
jgi:protein disulfide-isomerase